MEKQWDFDHNNFVEVLRNWAKTGTTMTWIASMASQFGYAVCVSDIRITFTKAKKTYNGLRKVYKVTDSLGFAFAGSVSVGFKLLEDIRQQKDRLHDHSALMNSWPKQARHIFASCKKQNSSLIVFGLDSNDAQKPAPFVYRLRSPDFIPHKAEGAKLLSIGSGAKHYASAIQEVCNQPNPFAVYENRGFSGSGAGVGVMAVMTLEIRHQPTDDISEELLCSKVSVTGFDEFPYRANITNANTGEVREVGMPQLASSWNEVLAIAKSLNLRAIDAVC